MIPGISNKTEVRTFLLIFAYIHVILLAFYFAWPVWDTQFTQLASTGRVAYNAYTFVWWFIFVFIVFNIILIHLLFSVLTDPSHKSRADVHFIFTILTLVVNVVFLALCVVIYFFFRNKSYTGKLPFNDPRWCCYYYPGNADQCYNTAPCPVLPDLMTNNEFILHWIFSGVFFLIALLHLGVNRLLRTSGIVPKTPPSREEGQLLGVAVSIIYIALYAYWAAFPLWDTIFINGFPLLGIPPSPGPFYTTRNGYQWWFLWFLVSNLAPPMLFFIAINFRRSNLASNALFWLTLLVSIVTFASLAVFIGVWIFDCNYSWSSDSICNDYRYCCELFSTASATCPNVTPCPPGNITLYPNPDFIQHIIFGFIFLLAGTVETWLVYRLRKYKIIK